jgi:hypothetical protein
MNRSALAVPLRGNRASRTAKSRSPALYRSEFDLPQWHVLELRDTVVLRVVPTREIGMSGEEFTFEIARVARVDVDLRRHRALISCETTDGKSIHLDADLESLEKIHEKIENRMETLWS